MAELHQRYGVHVQRLLADVGDSQRTQLHARAAWHKNGHVRAQPGAFRYQARITQANMALEAFQLRHPRHVPGRQDLAAPRAPDAQVGRLALEVGGGHLLDVFVDAVEGGYAGRERPAGVVHETAKSTRADIVDPFDGVRGLVMTYSRACSSKYPYCIGCLPYALIFA